MPIIPPSPPPPITAPSPFAPPTQSATAPPNATPSPGARPSTPPSPGAVPSPAATPVPGASPQPQPSTSSGPLVLAKTRLQLNVGAASAPIAISGGVAPLRVTLSSPIAAVQLDPVARTLVLRGISNGTATVTVMDASGASASASLLVAPNAGSMPSTVSLDLTGNPSSDFVVAQIQNALLRAVQPLPGAALIAGPVQLPASLVPGQRIDAPLRFHVDGKDRYVDVDGITNAAVSIEPPAPVPPTVLFYSDDPEELSGAGVLFRGTLSRDQPVRLYYYHQAKVPNLSVAIVLDAPSGGGRVNVTGRGAGPNPAIMYVGQLATYHFLDDHARQSGLNLDVAAGTPLALYTSDAPLKAGDLVAGALDFELLDGNPVNVDVVALSPGADLSALLGGDELLSDGKRRRGAYDIAQPFPLALAYAVGGPEPAPVSVGGGDPPIPNLRAGGRPLAGDYGILRNVNLTLSNPTQAPATVYLYEKPIGYPVTTTIDFNGDAAPTRLQCAKQRVRYLVRGFDVPAGGNATISGTYMTDGGSTYPLDFGLTSTPPSPLPVSMTAPDGCFPKPVASPSPTPSSTSPPATPSPSPLPSAPSAQATSSPSPRASLRLHAAT